MDSHQTASPQVPQFRITLFYGPDPQEGDPSSQNCTFNVKKRSWKSGVQVTVNITDLQLARLRTLSEFEPWLEQVVQAFPKEEVDDAECRAQDLFVQIVSSFKLDLAIERGITQENQSIPGEDWDRELDDVVANNTTRIKSKILTELDIPV